MRVLVIHTYYKLKGGEDSVVANEIELLRSQGVEVEQLSFSNSGSTLLKLIQVPFNYGSYQKTICKVQEFKPDVVHIHNLHFSGSAGVVYALKTQNVPIVMTLHNYRLLCPSGSLYHDNHLFLDSLKPGFAWSAVKKGVYQNSKVITFWIAASMYLHEKLGTWKSINKFILLGEQSRELFATSKLSSFAGKMVVKPNFCFPVLSASAISSDAAASLTASPTITIIRDHSYYLYVGRLTEEKGVPVLLNAFKESGHQLRIIGTGPLEDLVQDYARKYSNIIFAGPQPKERVSEYMQGASALIFPSVWYETFGMVVIEAFSAGVPVVASDLGNIKNMITDGINGLRFKVADHTDLMKKIEFFEGLTGEELDTYSQNARNTYLKHYSPEANAIQLLALYQSVAPGV
jgi:glycosyltransferase involved in cell wall biosynthesis